MTDIVLTKNNGNIVQVSVSGHTGYGTSGSDILCSAISSIVQTALLGILDVVCVNVDFARDERNGQLTFAISSDMDESKMHDCQLILKTMLCGLSDLNTEYSDFMNLEVKNVY
ncbi:MAG: ribosomal-processing cysteine protease Prp [Clostridia bacterium]|nr:ribosomal-processing cysteine protease Prp [Clostridia bacterium]